MSSTRRDWEICWVLLRFARPYWFQIALLLTIASLVMLIAQLQLMGSRQQLTPKLGDADQ